MQPGEEYRPFKLFNGSVVPFSLAAQRDIGPGAKLLFGELAALMGKNGYCHPSVAHLAKRLGVSVDQITRWLRELREARLIKSRRRGPGSNAERIFIWHPSLAGSVKKGAILETAKIPIQGQTETAKTRVLKPQKSGSGPGNLRVAYKEEEVLLRGSFEEVSSSELAVSFLEPSTPEATDDESPSSQKTEAANPEDLDALVNTARDQLRIARAAGAGARPEDVGLPDRAITIQILKVFSDHADFVAWLEGSVHRGVARKAKSATWGLYLTDARNQVEDLKFKREAHEKQERVREIEQERRRVAEAAEQRKMDAPMPALQAFSHIQGRVPALPWPLNARLVRTGATISPNELERQAKAWRRCVACDETGTMGSAIDRDLRFCECAAGVEAQYRDGANFAEQEIARVHADAKSLLVASCRALNRQFAGDALEAAAVIDDGGTLEITPATMVDSMCLTDADVQGALGRVGWKRAVRILRPCSPKAAREPQTPVSGGPRPITQADIDAVLTQRRASGGEDGPDAE